MHTPRVDTTVRPMWRVAITLVAGLAVGVLACNEANDDAQRVAAEQFALDAASRAAADAYSAALRRQFGLPDTQVGTPLDTQAEAG